MISELGYTCQSAGGAVEALKLIAADSQIGIVVTDIQMPAIDGLTLLDELSSRFMPTRALVNLVITGQATLQTAIYAMRSRATDFLLKPVNLNDLATALRRATALRTRLLGKSTIAALAHLANSQANILDENVEASQPDSPTLPQLQHFVRLMVKARQNRDQFLDTTLFSEPAWDILLDLTSAALEGKLVPVSSACAASQVPLSTALRYVRQLTDSGLISSRRDPTDKRRSLLELQPETFEAMKGYLVSLRQQQMAPLS